MPRVDERRIKTCGLHQAVPREIEPAKDAMRGGEVVAQDSTSRRHLDRARQPVDRSRGPAKRQQDQGRFVKHPTVDRASAQRRVELHRRAGQVSRSTGAARPLEGRIGGEHRTRGLRDGDVMAPEAEGDPRERSGWNARARRSICGDQTPNPTGPCPISRATAPHMS